MKKAHRSFSIVLTIAIVLAFMPVNIFAEDETESGNFLPDIIVSSQAKDDITYPDATFIFTDKDGNEIDAEFNFFTNKFTNFPEEGSKIRVFFDGIADSSPDKEYIYHDGEFDDRGVLSPFRWNINGGNYNSKTASLRIYEVNDRFNTAKGYLYDVNVDMPVRAARAPMKNFSYYPSLVNVPSESIKMKAYDGSIIYNLEKRATHSNGKKSSFADGEKITVYFEDGTSKVYVNKVVDNTDMFVSADGERTTVLATNYLMNLGMNEVTLYLMNQSETKTALLRVYVKKPGEADYTENGTNPSGESGNQQSGESSTTIPSGSYTDTPSVAGSRSSAVSLTVAKTKIISAKKTNNRIKLKLKPLTKKQLKNVSRIQVQYGTDKRFKRAGTKSVFIDKNKKTYTTKKLKKGTYYIRVRNMKKVGDKKFYSKWSPVKKVGIK